MGFERVTRVLDNVVLVLWLAGFICNLLAALLGLQRGLSGSGPAAYGNITVGSLWVLTLVGILPYAFYEQYSSRRLESRRRKFFRHFFITVLPTRLIFSLIWACVLPTIEHTKDHQIFAVACLLDIFLLGRHLLLVATSPDWNGYIDFEETTESSIKKNRSDAQVAGYISAAKATLVIEAREQQYGPKLSNAKPTKNNASQKAPGDTARSQTIIYAPRERFTDDQKNGRAALELSLDELEHFPGFLRCTCCLDCPPSPPPDQRKHNTESASMKDEHWKHREKRLSFLQKDPIAAVFDFVPRGGTTGRVNNLCDICDRVCAEIIDHFSAVERRSKVEKFLYPRRDICSIYHCDSPSSLSDSSVTCHLCSLIWASLNIAQQNTLLRADKEFIENLCETQSPDTSSSYQMERSIRLVVFEDLIVPHFGGFKRPRRWEKSSMDSESIRIGVGSEFAAPIYLPGPAFNWESFLESVGSGRGRKETSGPIVLPVSDHTGSDVVIDMIKHALQDRTGRSSRLPTRLIDVRDFPIGKAQLQRSADLHPRRIEQPYIALSHCWGSIDMPKLLRDNINWYMDGFNISKLPRTFREAIEVTFRLGIDYIWIDSLCIIQDDPADWDYEATLMASIYANAFCTVAAVASVDGNGGLFRSQKPKELSPCLIGLEKNGDPTYAVPCLQPDDRVLRANIALSTWNSRGWCLQERYLSSAVVYFCESQVYIGLGEQLAISPDDNVLAELSNSAISLAEPPTSGGIGDEDLLIAESSSDSPTQGALMLTHRAHAHPRSRGRKDKYTLKGQLEIEEMWDERFYPRGQAVSLNHIRTSMVEQRLGTNTVVDQTSIWWAAVNEFSTRDLTNPSDKLPAIRGLAVHLHNLYLGKTDSQYIMGHWTKSMLAGLLWYADFGSERPRPEVYRAPSWSWASVDAVISNDSLRLKEDDANVKLTDIDIKEHSSSVVPSWPWLRDRCVPGSSITLRGLLKIARFGKATLESEKRYYVARSLVRHETTALEPPSALESLFSPVSTESRVGPLCHPLLDPSSQARIGWFLPDSPEDLPSDIFCLKIQVTPQDPEDPQATWAVRGLVLVLDTTSAFHEPIASNSRKPVHAPQHALRYRRVGYFELDCEFRGTHVGSKYSHTDEVAMPRRPATKVKRFVEFPIMNRPELDPHGFFADLRPQDIIIV